MGAGEIDRLGADSTAFEGHVIERALFWGRCAGGAVIVVLGRVYGIAALLTTAIDSELGFLRRTTERTIHERTVAELERMQRLDSLGALAGGIAHDFNNLLAVILNNAHLAARSTGAEAVRAEIEGIVAAAERGASLTRQMLVFARGAQARRSEPIDVRREVRYVEQLLRRTIGEGIELGVRIAPDVRSVLLEPGQLEQILMNLAVNARDAMPAGGTILVAIDEIENDGDEAPMLPSGRYVRIVVRDDGSGMTPAVAARAFEPFFTTKPKGRGTGLGLSTVYGLARRAGGHVSVASTIGIGTAFTIHLPAAAGLEVAEAAATGVEDGSSNGERVLVVDDEEGVRRVAAEILRRGGFQVAEASRPSEALGLAADGIDLLVSDVVLPEMSGRELAARFRERFPALPVLFISGYAPAETDAEDPSLLAKPFTPDALLARAVEALRTPVEVA